MAGFLAPLAISAGTSLLGGLFGKKKAKADPEAWRKQDQIDRQRLGDFERQGEGSLRRMTEALTADGMPAFQQGLQNIRETATRRGVSLGGQGNIGTNYEGDLASAFQRNIANAIAGQARGTYETSLDRLYGDKDRELAAKNAKAQGRSNMWGSLLGAAGQVAGGWLGGRK